MALASSRWPALLLGLALQPGAAAALDDAAAMRDSQAAIGREVGDVAFVTSAGTTVRLGALRGKPLVISLIYTSCAGICPATTRQLAAAVQVARGILGVDGFNVLSVGFDVARDTPQALGAFAAQQRAGDAHWLFAGGSQDAVDALARDTGFRFAPLGGGFEHLIQTTVLDGRGRVVLQLYGNEFRPLDLAEPLRRIALGAPVTSPSPSSLFARVRLLCSVYDPALGRYRTDYTMALSLAIAVSTLVGLLAIVIRAWRHGARRGVT